MALAHTSNAMAVGHSARREGLFAQIVNYLARRRIYAQTYRELSELTDRELNDLGISRFQIRQISSEAANRS